MNAVAMQNKINCLNGTARKVYECVPITEDWTKQQIMSEMLRVGVQYDPRSIDGCLHALVEYGIVKEVSRDSYQRIEIPFGGKGARKEKPKLTAVDTKPNPEKVMDPLSRLAHLAADARKLSGNLAILADAIDDAALEAAQAIEASAKNAGKLGQLRELLQSLTNE